MRVGTRSDRINAVWDAGSFIGSTRAQARVTIQRATQHGYTFPTRVYRTINHAQVDVPRELPNIKSIAITRAIDQDAATCVVTFFNTKPLPIGALPQYPKDIDADGWYTFNRGFAPTAERWGYTQNTWRHWIREDRILRTYQGYGINPQALPQNDANLIQTGTWLIDEVVISSNGEIVATCRDLAAFLIDQYVYPPVVPLAQYPLFFELRHPETTIIPSAQAVITPGGSSNDVYGNGGVVYGHTDDMAFDASMASYWLSIGNAKPSEDWSYEWVQANCNGANTKEVRFTPWKGDYLCFVSVKVGGVWQGSLTVPYNPNAGPAAPNGSNIKYVASLRVGFEEAHVVPINFDGVEAVRLTFTDLADSDLGTFQYRAGVKNFDVFTEPQSQVRTVGDYNDYTDIVKQLCAMGGFYWPRGAPPLASSRDGVLGPGVTGRVWGDFESAGTGPKVDLPETVFDKKALMDGINYVKEILGYLFFVDEMGGCVFRSPNIWTVGNFTTDVNVGPLRQSVKQAAVLSIDEDRHLTGYQVKMSNRNKRRKITVGTVDGKVSAEVAGDETIPNNFRPLNMERHAIFTDQNFTDVDECRVMAELIKIRQNFTFRQGMARMKANPNIQPDDQVRIIERRTGEGYLHYVAGISTTWDAATGKYDMDLTTFWLGEAASTAAPGAAVVDITLLSTATQDYLKRKGLL